MTLASLKEAQALMALQVGSDAVVSAAGTGGRATDSSPGDKLRAWGGSGLTPWGRVGGTEVDNSGHFFSFHGSGGRSGRSGRPRGPSPDQPSCPWEVTPEGVSTAPTCRLRFHPHSSHPPQPACFLPASPHCLPRTSSFPEGLPSSPAPLSPFPSQLLACASSCTSPTLIPLHSPPPPGSTPPFPQRPVLRVLPAVGDYHPPSRTDPVPTAAFMPPFNSQRHVPPASQRSPCSPFKSERSLAASPPPPPLLLYSHGFLAPLSRIIFIHSTNVY